MDKARFGMWESSKSSSESSFVVNQSARSWEEEAFEEDAARCFGAFTWPPRCYSCSFCGREFKSAQALGGHMNSHRRDKARLKQSPREKLNHHQNCFQSPSDQTRNCPNQICPWDCNHKVNTDETWSYYSVDPSWSNSSASARVFSFLDSKIEEENMKKQSSSRPHVADIIFKSDLPVSLNLSTVGSGNKEVASCKRKRSTDGVSSPPPFFLKATMEDLDLELKLGD